MNSSSWTDSGFAMAYLWPTLAFLLLLVISSHAARVSVFGRTQHPARPDNVRTSDRQADRIKHTNTHEVNTKSLHQGSTRSEGSAAISKPRKTLKSRQYTIGLVTVLPTEMAAVKAVLDEEHNGPSNLERASKDYNSYV